jgi:hypothetical protein
MRTNIEIDDELMQQAMQASQMKTKRAAVEAGLAMLVKSHAQQGIWKLFGKVEFYPDYDHKAMRVNDKWDRSELAGQFEVPSRPKDSASKRINGKKAA